MKVPISRQLTDNLILPCIAFTGVGLFDLYSTGQKRLDQNISFILVFGIPALLFGWFLVDRKVEFKENKKVRKADRLFQLPFSLFSTLLVFIISSFFLVGGLAEFFGDKDTSVGIPLLLIGLTVIILTAISVEHPKIWFSDTFNMEDMSEEIKNTPKENFSAYQDGIFSYADNSFTIQLDKENKTVKWEEITLIKAYKIDLYTVDSIVFEIHLQDTLITISDDSTGYGKFMEIAAERLSNFKTDWFEVVAFPAFETNLTTIYERQTSDETKGSHLHALGE